MITNFGSQKIRWQQNNDMIESLEEPIISPQKENNLATSINDQAIAEPSASAHADIDLSLIIFNLSKKLELKQAELQKIRSELYLRDLQIETSEFRNEELLKAKYYFETKVTSLEQKFLEEDRRSLEAKENTLKKITELEMELKQFKQNSDGQGEIIRALRQELVFFEDLDARNQDLKKDSKNLADFNAGLQENLKIQTLEKDRFEKENIQLKEKNERLEAQVASKDQLIKLLEAQIHESRIECDNQANTLDLYREQIQNVEKKLEKEQELKTSLYISTIQQIEKRLSEEEKKNLLLAAFSRRPSSKSEISEPESLDVIREWMMRING